MKREEILQVQKLSIRHNKGALLVKDSSFELESRQCLGLIGESGSGKSMTCKAILGLLSPKTFDVSGQILFHGDNLLERPQAELNRIRGRRITMVMQNPMTAFNPAFKVGNQVVETLCTHLSIRKREAYQMAVEQLQEMNLPRAETLMNSYPHTLSGGMLQRVMIALALIVKPELIIADEATTALDVSTQAIILDEFKQIKATGISLLLVTHDFGVVAELADKVLVMKAGTIIERGETQSLLLNPQEKYTKELIEASFLRRR
mgnify:CR=1 FL=1